MDKSLRRIASKLGRIFDFALVKPMPWSIIDAHEKLRETDDGTTSDETNSGDVRVSDIASDADGDDDLPARPLSPRR